MRLTWKREPRQPGLAGVRQFAHRPRGWHLSCGRGNVVARVMYDRDRGAWYWYGGGPGGGHHNTLWDNTTYPTEEAAQAACMAYMQGLLAEGKLEAKQP